MSTRLAARDATDSLHAHAAAQGRAIRQRYGAPLDWQALQRLLTDRAFVRYPCEIAFESGPLHPGEFAHPVGKGERPEDGFIMYVHPFFLTRLDRVAHLVLYQLVRVNYGEFASAADAEVFGANALGIPTEDYYRILCDLADQLGGA